MFGKPPANDEAAAAWRPPAADVARIQGGGLVQLIVSKLAPMTFALFLNGQPVTPTDVESLTVIIEAPDPGSATAPTARATLARYVRTVSGERSLQPTELFPCTLELVALERRISVTSTRVDSLDGLWINLGLKADGSSAEVSGAKTLQILLTEGILSAKLTWVDGDTEDLLPQPILQ